MANNFYGLPALPEYGRSEGDIPQLLTIRYTRVIDGDVRQFAHVAPPCSKYKVTEADVDKNGSGRSENDGTFYRERLGWYCKVDITWDIIPNTEQYVNWYRVLKYLPEFFEIECVMGDGTTSTFEAYRSSDLATDLYFFKDKNNQIWQGLSASFTMKDIQSYNENFEPEMVH